MAAFLVYVDHLGELHANPVKLGFLVFSSRSAWSLPRRRSRSFLTANSNQPTSMNIAELKNFESPDEVREFPKGRLELIKIGGATIGRAVFQPGWRWAESVQPLAKTRSCEAPHFQYHVSGILHIKMDDGTDLDCKPGDVSLLPSGHDAWTVGDEPAVVIDFQGMIDFARSK